jgi:hypothetical protein
MGTFRADEADNYGSQGSGSYFRLENDKDTALVRFMYNTIDDVQGHAVHEVEVDGKRRYVNCLRAYNEPIANCPLCEANNKQIAKVFVLLYDIEEQQIKIWDRGRTIFSKISGLSARYNPLISMPFEIERNGKKGDTSTTYEMYPTQQDDITFEDLPEVPEILGNIVLDKTFEDMQEYLQTGSFSDTADAPVVRGRKEEAPQVRRRTAVPATGRSTPPATTSKPRSRF